jgi:hypothetical protein
MMTTHLHLLFACDPLADQYIIQELDRILIFNIKKPAATSFDHPIVIENINSYQQLLNTYRYIYRNPVEAGLCQKAEDYYFSSLMGVLGRTENNMNCVDLFHVIQNPIKILNWLNAQDSNRLFEVRSYSL